MPILMVVRIALKALSRNKLRTSLTMLGMIIGVGAVITLIALGNGAQAVIEAEIRAAGTNMISVFPGSVTSAGGVRMGEGQSTRLTYGDAWAVRTVPSVAWVAEVVNTRQQLIASTQNWNSSIVGTTPDFVEIKAWPMKYGSFFTDLDVDTGAKVIALGANISEILFGADVDPTGEHIRVRNHVVRVVGVMAPKGASSSGQNQDDQAFMPYSTVQRKLTGQWNLHYMLASADSADGIDQTAEAVRAAIREQHGIRPGQNDDFRVQTQDEMIAMRTESTNTMTSLLSGIAAVSLMVGGIGIMNIMLVSVTERTREIGLRLAVGARSRDVLSQFLVEALMISLVGGGLGIAFGYGAAEFIKWYRAWPAVIPVDSILLSFGVAAGIGVFFGFYPARKASALDPIDALRFE